MLKIETARKLKEACLKWEPEKGDSFLDEHCEIDFLDIDKTRFAIPSPCIWLPRLDQLLGEIEARGYSFILEKCGPKESTLYSLTLMDWDECVAEISFGDGWKLLIDFTADSPDEAAAQAVLWILQEVNAQ